MAPTDPLTSPHARRAAAVLAGAVLVLIGYVVGVLTSAPKAPGESSAEAGFARDMSDHHAQAVELGMIAYRKATLPEVRAIGGDIAITQQGQIGVMQTWLADWGLGPTSTAPPISWMPEGQRELNGNLMPGLATREEVGRLQAATGEDVDILFCQLMLRHHQAGVHMVEGLLSQSDHPQVRELAESMEHGQTDEIEVLLDILERLGAEPL